MYIVFVFSSILRLLKVKLPTFNVHFQEHLRGYPQRFLLDLQKEETDQTKPQTSRLLSCHRIRMHCNTVTNLKKHLKRNRRYEWFPVTAFIANRLKQKTFSLKKKKKEKCDCHHLLVCQKTRLFTVSQWNCKLPYLLMSRAVLSVAQV